MVWGVGRWQSIRLEAHGRPTKTTSRRKRRHRKHQKRGILGQPAHSFATGILDIERVMVWYGMDGMAWYGRVNAPPTSATTEGCCLHVYALWGWPSVTIVTAPTTAAVTVPNITAVTTVTVAAAVVAARE